MSPRAACRLESLGFGEVYDYMPGKVDWLARGLPSEGAKADELRAAALAHDDVVTCAPADPAGELLARIEASPYGFALVLSEQRVVLGRLRRRAVEADARGTAGELMEPGPSTVRAHVPATRLLERLQSSGLHTAIVTAPDGALIGVLRRADAEAMLR
jgi:CBS-domain-containing membrane protein